MIADVFQYLFQADMSSLEEGEKKAISTDKQLRDGLQKTDKVADIMGNSFTELIASAGGALTALLSFSALSAGIMETAEYVDNLSDVSKRLGENVNDMAAWQESVKKAGGDIGAFQGSLKSFTGSLNGLDIMGKGKLLPFFKELGINIEDNNGKVKSALQLYPEIAESFEKLSKTESAGIGQKLGLDEGTVGLLQQGRKAVEEQISAQKKLFKITDEQVETFGNFGDAIDDTKTAFRGMFVQLGSDVLPILQYFLEKVQGGVSYLAEHKDFVTGIFIALGTAITAYAIPAIIRFGIATITAFAPFYLIGGLIAGIVVLFALLYDDIKTFLDGGNSAFEQFLNWLGMTSSQIDEVRNMFVGLGNSVTTIFTAIFEILKAFLSLGGIVAKGLYQVFEPLLWLFGQGIMGAIKGLINGIKWVADGAKKLMDFLGVGGDTKLDIASEETTKQIMDVQGADSVGSKGTPDYLKNIENSNYKSALDGASNNPYNNSGGSFAKTLSNTTKNNTVTIEKVEVQTQATNADDISKAIGTSLSSQLKNTTATFEDGIEG